MPSWAHCNVISIKSQYLGKKKPGDTVGPRIGLKVRVLGESGGDFEGELNLIRLSDFIETVTHLITMFGVFEFDDSGFVSATDFDDDGVITLRSFFETFFVERQGEVTFDDVD